MQKSLTESISGISIAAVFCLSAASAQAEMGTEAIFDHHLKAFVERNMEENLADYTEDSVVIIPNAIFTGLDEIEGLFAGLFAEFAKEGASIELTEKRVHNNIVYISWQADTPDNTYHYATDTFVIEDGKIVTQTIGLVVEAK